MLNDVLDGLKGRHAESLNRPPSFEFARGEALEHADCLANGFLQSLEKLLTSDGSALGKLQVALAPVGHPAESGNNPLPDVSLEVER